MIEGIFIIIAFLFLIRGVLYCFNILSVIFFFGSKLNVKILETNEEFSLVVLIPLLKEQSAIFEMMEYFSKMDISKIKIKLIIITTEKELIYKSQTNTIELAEKYIPEFNTKLGFDLFEHLHYPYSDGVMAHQLNYALENLNSFQSESTYICVYNADSKPNPKTFHI